MIERFIFGKKYINTTNKDEKIKLLKSDAYIYFCAFIFVLLFSVGIFSYLMYLQPSDEIVYQGYSNEQVLFFINITYEGLNSREEFVSKEILRDVKPLYLEGMKLIVFTNNLSKHCEECGGANYPGGKIYIKYVNSKIGLKRTLCHELLHNFFISGELAHIVLSDVSRYEVCYDEDQI